MVKTTGFPGRDPTQAPRVQSLAPDLARGVQSPRESLGLSLPSALEAFPPAQEILPVSRFQRSPVSLRPKGLQWVAHKPSASGQPGACFPPPLVPTEGLESDPPEPPEAREGLMTQCRGPFPSSREVEQGGSRCGWAPSRANPPSLHTSCFLGTERLLLFTLVTWICHEMTHIQAGTGAPHQTSPQGVCCSGPRPSSAYPQLHTFAGQGPGDI